MNILIVHNRYTQSGGEDIVLSNEKKILEAHDNQVYTYIRDNSKEVFTWISVIKTIWNYSEYKNLESKIKSINIDIIHVHNTFPIISPTIYYVAEKFNIPVVQTLHNYRFLCPNALLFRNGKVCDICLKKSYPWPGILYKCYKNSTLITLLTTLMVEFHRIIGTWQNKIDLYIALTEFSRQKFVNSFLPEKKITKKPNFVLMDPKPKNFIGSYALFIGRISEEKGVHTLMDAWDNLNNITLQVCGDGPLLEELKIIKRIRGNIIFSGKVDNKQVIESMKEAKFLIVPSVCYENFPLTIVEAYACGLPVISSRLGAMAELVHENETGLLFEAGNPNDLAKKVQWAWDHPKEMAQMGRNARAEYKEKYTAEKNYEMLMEIYQKAIENHNANNKQKQQKWSVSRLSTARKNHSSN